VVGVWKCVGEGVQTQAQEVKRSKEKERKEVGLLTRDWEKRKGNR